MDPQNLFASTHVGPAYDHTAIEASRTQQSRIKHIGSVCRRDQNYTVVRLKAVHFDEQLVQGLLTLIVSTAQARAAVTSNSVNFIDKDDAGRILLALLEKVAHAARADAHEHLDEIRARNREERNICLAGDCPRQQGLTGSRRSNQQYAFGNAAAELLEFLRLTQKLDNLLELLLGLVNASNVLEGDLLLLH